MDSLIKRNDVVNELEDMRGYRDEDGYVMIFKSDAIDRINCIATTDRLRGHWVDGDGNIVPLDKDGLTRNSAWCSICGDWLTASDEYATRGWFCPNCGADMRGENDGRG